MQYLEYLFPVISSLSTFFLLSGFSVAKYIDFIPEDQKKEFNLTFYTAVVSIFIILIKNSICFIRSKFKTKVVVIAHKRNETPDSNHNPEVIFNNQVAELTFSFHILGSYKILENMELIIQLPIWADFQPKQNIYKETDNNFRVKIRDLMGVSGSQRKIDCKRQLEVIISEIPDGDSKDSLIMPSLKDKRTGLKKVFPCKFESNSFKIIVL